MACDGGFDVNRGVHAAVVLAAGGSRRLGQPKQLLTRGGETLVHRTVRLALATSPSQVLVVAGADGEAIAASVADLSCDVVCNGEWRTGISGSLRVAGAHLDPHAQCVLVLICDQPVLEQHHLDALLDGARAKGTGCAATVHGEALGVPAVVPRDWFDSMLTTGDRGFGPRLAQQRAVGIYQLQAPELGADVDNAQDLATARKQGCLDG